MTNRPRTEQKLTPPTAEEWRMRNREARAKKRQELAEKIADRITPDNCSTIMKIASDIHILTHLMVVWLRHDEASIEPIKIIELQNHIHELQTYLVRLEETAIGMHD